MDILLILYILFLLRNPTGFNPAITCMGASRFEFRGFLAHLENAR